MLRTASALAAAAAVATIAGTAQANVPVICFSDTISLQNTNWSDSITVPKFDPSLGQLQRVIFTLSANVEGSAAFESLDAAPATVTMSLQAMVTLFRPDNTTLNVVIPTANTSDGATAFDGTMDFGGTSGKTYANLSAMDDNQTDTTAAADLALFTGAGTITLPVTAMGTSSGTGAGNLLLQFLTQAGAEVEVCYEYIPTPGSLALLGLGGLIIARRKR